MKELREALGIVQGGGSDTKVAASIVHRDVLAFTDVVSIDKGTSSGVQTGMVVLSAQGTLIGTVTKSSANISFVRLITDSKSKVQAQVQEPNCRWHCPGKPRTRASLQPRPGRHQGWRHVCHGRARRQLPARANHRHGE